MGKAMHAGAGKVNRPPLPKLPLENLNIGAFGYSGFAQPLDSLDSSSHTLLSDYDPASVQVVAPDEQPKADEPLGVVRPADNDSSSVTALRARLMQSFETEGKLRIQAEMAAADLECALEDRTKALRDTKAAEKRAVDAERTLKDYLATPAEAKVKRLEKQVAKFMEDNSRLRLQVQALQEENQRHVSLYQRSERALKALQEKERAQARALLKVQELGHSARAAPEVAEAWNTPVQTSNMSGVEDLRAQVMELKGALIQATNTNSSLLRSSSELKKVQALGEDAQPTVHAISQIDHRLANIENSMGRHAAAGMGNRASLGWQVHAQQPSQQIQGWNNLAPYPQMNPAPTGSPQQYRGEVPASRQRPRPQSATEGGTRAPPSPNAGRSGEQPHYPPRFQRAHTHFPDRTVRKEYVDVPRAANRIRPRHGSAGPHRRGEGLGAPGRALAPTYSALPKDGFAVPPSKMSEAALANARVEYAAECRRIKDMLSVKLEEIPM